MDLKELQAHWNRFGEEDPLWAILTSPGTKYGRWDREEFFRSGVLEIQAVLDRVDKRVAEDGGKLSRQRVLDFGCGVGRLSQALADHFDECDGVDIAPSMLAEAARANRHGSRCRYHLNNSGDLTLFEDGSFDFIYTAHVLQHMEPQYSKRFIADFVRVLKPEGYALFELVTEPVVGATEALPDDAFAARVSFPAPAPTLVAGARHMVPVTVVNLSPRTWPASGHDGWFFVLVGNHWFGAGGDLVRLDDGRAHLPHDLGPGQAADVEVEITAPSTPGRYRLQVDLVQEGVGWFADRGSTPADTAVVVTAPQTSRTIRQRLLGGRPGRVANRAEGNSPPATRPPAEPVVGEAVMEMHGITEEEVAAVVDAAGGRVLDVIDWDEIGSAPPSTDWHRRGFLVRRAAGAPAGPPE